MITLDEALQITDTVSANRQINTESIDTISSAGMILMEDQFSMVYLPPFRKSLVDGYTVSGKPDSGFYIKKGILPAGVSPHYEMESGTAVRVMTGAPVPQNADRVIKFEDTEEIGDRIKVPDTPVGSFIAEKGNDMKTGDLVAKKGSFVKPALIAALIGCGINRVKVSRRISASIISSGNEIVESLNELSPAKIIDVNSPMLRGLCEEASIDVIRISRVSDDYKKLEASIMQGLESSDFVILSGGVSMGDFDFVPEIVRSIGAETHFHKVAIQPGKPNLFATYKDKFIFGLPGNPMAVFLGFNLFVKRCMLLLQGAFPHIKKIGIPLYSDFKRRDAERLLFVPCRINEKSFIEPRRARSSADLASLSEADGFMLVPAGANSLAAGSKVEFVPMSGLACV